MPRTDPGRPRSAQRCTVVETWSGSPAEIAQDLGVVPHADLPRAHRSRSPTRSNSRPSHREPRLALSVEICAVATGTSCWHAAERCPGTDRPSGTAPFGRARPSGLQVRTTSTAWTPQCAHHADTIGRRTTCFRLHDAYLAHNKRLTCKARISRPSVFRCRPAGGKRRQRRPSRAKQGPRSRRGDARATTKGGLRRQSRAGPSVAPSRL